MSGKRWTEEEIQALKEAYAQNHETGFRKVAAQRIARNPANFARKARMLGVVIKPHPPLSPADKAQISATQHLRLAFGAHPRGMLGKRHSLETKQRLSERRAGQPRGPQSPVWRQHIAEAQATRLRERPESFPNNQGSRQGRRPDLNNQYFRSSWEANYARLLNHQGMAWQYEKKTFWFRLIKRGCRSYTPDFYLPSSQEYHEVKGWMDQKSRTKLSRMRKYYPEVRVVVLDRAFFADIERQRICRLIPGWECPHNSVGS